MAGERRAGERLWLAVLAITALVVAGDFVRHPFIGAPDGRASPAASDVAILQPLGDSASPLRGDARALASALTRPGFAAQARSSGRSAAATIVDFARRGERDGRRLLLLSSAALAEMARALRQPASGHEAAEARAALRLLGRLRPVAPVARDATSVAVPARWGPPTLAALAERMRLDPAGTVAGIGADAASKAVLAGTVSALGVAGRVPYRVFPTGAEATLALAAGEVDLIVAPRSQTIAERRRGTVRPLTTGRDAPAAARAVLGAQVWSVLVGPPALAERARHALARRAARALRTPAWRAHRRRRALGALRAWDSAFVARERRRAMRLATLAARVPDAPEPAP